MTPSVIELQKVSFTYPGGVTALNSLSVSITRGRRTVVLGRNGSGKTTLFSLLNGLKKPHQGEIRLDGEPLRYDRQGLLNVRQSVGMVFQDPDSQLFSACIYEDISFGPLNLGLPDAEVRSRVDKALAQMKLTEVADRPTHALSFGQKKRACIAGVLAMEPHVLILDEPFAGLDPAMSAEFMTILDDLHRGGTSLIIATHDLDLAYAWADDVIILHEGRLLAQGPAPELLAQPSVHAELGAAPLVAELAAALALTGTRVYDKGYQPRTGAELVRALHTMSRQEIEP